MTAKAKSPLTLRKVLQQIHLWVGVIFCLPFVMLGITGSILVFEHELNDLFVTPPVHATAAGPQKTLGEIVAAARAFAPQGAAATMVGLPDEAGEPASVRFQAAGRAQQGPGGGTQVLVDPVSLEVLATRQPSGDSWLRQIFFLHANLMVRGDRSGRETIGWLGVGMTILAITGLVLWWPMTGRLMQALVFTWKAKGARFHRDLHAAIGFWSLIVFLVVTISGVYLAFPQQLGAAVRAVLPARDLRAGFVGPNAFRVTPLQGAQPMSVDDAASLALETIPGTSVRFVGLPVRPEQPMRVGLVRPGHKHGAPMATVFVDPWERKVIEARDPRSYTIGETIMAWQHALHAGEGLGWTWKILVFLSGFLPPLFAVTGVSMWLIKRRNRRRTALEARAAD